MTRFVTKPLKLLMQSVQEIEIGTYEKPADGIPPADEIGQLKPLHRFHVSDNPAAVPADQTRMNGRISRWNCGCSPSRSIHIFFTIHWNVLIWKSTIIIMILPPRCCQTSAATSRISLSYGNSQHLISQEVDQVKAYVNIMNYRFRHSIHLTTNIDGDLLSMKILKSILQPLVENALKHGFSIDSSVYFPIAPMIDISIWREPDTLSIAITDNGAGIDIEHAKEIMYGSGDRCRRQTSCRTSQYLPSSQLLLRKNRHYIFFHSFLRK